MPRSARLIMPHCPHYITQYAKGSDLLFHSGEDYACYVETMAREAARYDVRFWAYCLIGNRIKMIAVPKNPEGLALALRETHRLYTRYINEKRSRSGHLWKGRYYSFPMDAPNALMAARCIENEPVELGVVKDAGSYRWSSARYHLGKKLADPLVKRDNPLLPVIPDWAAFLQDGIDSAQSTEKERSLLSRHEKSGVPLGKVGKAGEESNSAPGSIAQQKKAKGER